jgi:hypothetical protein
LDTSKSKYFFCFKVSATTADTVLLLAYSFRASCMAYNGLRNGCRGRIADMTGPEALRVDTDGGIKPDMAFLALLVVCKPAFLCLRRRSSICIEIETGHFILPRSCASILMF